MELMMPQDRTIEEMQLSSALRDRRIFLCTEIERESIFKVMYYLDRLIFLDNKTGTKEPIEIVLDTYGGSCYHTISLCAKIKSMIANGYKIITTVHSTAFSGGFWILICGSERRALTDSRIMVHNILGGVFGKHQEMIEDMEETEAIWNKLKEITTSNTNISNVKMEEIKRMKFDWYFWGEEALSLGVIDKIL